MPHGLRHGLVPGVAERGRTDEAKQKGAFAALPSYADPPFYRRLVQHKIIGLYRTADFTDSELAEASPYLWGYTMSYNQIQQKLADWACSRLVGFDAAHAGMRDGARLSDRKRSFGVFLKIDNPDLKLETKILVDALRACGAEVAMSSTTHRNGDQARDQNDIAALKAKGVTSVICLCYTPNIKTFQTAARNQLYEPEWIVTSYPQLTQADGYDGDQADRTFGVTFEPMDRVPDDHPHIWALREADPTNPNAALRTSLLAGNDLSYRAFLMLMSGIQMAGPNLTPQTFEAGLRRTSFPNPDHPIMAGSVGFAGDHSMTDDGAEFWVSRTDPSHYSDRQVNGYTFCYVDGGRRYKHRTWPRGGERFFQRPCDSGNHSVA